MPAPGRCGAARMSATGGPAPASLTPAERRISLAAILASIFVATLTFAMSTPLLALRLEAAGVDGLWIGLNTATESAAILVFTLATPAFARRVGTARALYAGVAVMTLGVALLPVFPSLFAWFLLRFLMGAGVAVLWVLGETWLNTIADDATRGRTSGLYVAAMSAAYCLGFPLLILTGTEGIAPFAVMTVTIAATAIPLCLAHRLIPELGASFEGGFRTLFRREPAIMAAALANGAIIGIVLAFFAIYVGRLGVGSDLALLMLFVIAAGNVVLQLPVGMLADRKEGEPLLAGVAVLSIAGFVALPLLLDISILRWPLLFFWGGLIGAAYTIALAMLGRRYATGELAAANALFAFVYETGTFLGPLATGMALDLWNPHGFLAVGVAANFVFLAVVVLRGRGRANRRGDAPAPPG
jgi:MFS family permease